MSVDLIKFAFTAGELAPSLYGRPDLEKFDLGLAQCQNWFVDYHGGISTRPGFEFVDYVMDDDLEVVLFKFKFNSDIANTYVLMFGDGWVRFVQDGAYVLEADVAITVIAVSAGETTITAAAHGYSNGDWVKIGGRTFLVGVLTANTFKIAYPNGGPFDETLTGNDLPTTPTVANRIYTLTTVYDSTQLEGLSVFQINDVLRLTHTLYPPYDLKRIGHTNWTLTPTVFGSTVTSPSAGLNGTPGVAGSSGFNWTVTSVNYQGVEGAPLTYVVETAAVNFTVTAGSYKYEWTPVPGAAYYNVYRANLVNSGLANRGQQVGFIAKVYGAQHQELNTVPDFTVTPPQDNDPFAPGQVTSISVTAPGAGYLTSSTVLTITGGGGTGAAGIPIVSDTGTIIGAVVTNGGSGYTSSPTIGFTIGAGATATVEISPLTGCYPALSTRFQQRQIYAATLNDPLTIWGSQPGRLNNFDVSDVVSDSDAFQFDLDSDESTPIRHILAMKSGMLIMTDSGVWQMTGGGVGEAVTPTNAIADPHSYTGVSKLPPIKIDTDLIYQESLGAAIRLLAYNDFSKVYGGTDVSILSSHFFTHAVIVDWAFAKSPYSIVWSAMNNGSLLGFTLVKEQNVFAWTRHWTRGYFMRVVTVQEDDVDATYAIVSRLIGGVLVKYLERMTKRDFQHVEDSFQVDSGLRLPGSYPAADLNVHVVPAGLSHFVASAPVFAGSVVGKVLRVAGGKFILTVYESTTSMYGVMKRAPTDFLPESEDTVILDQLQGTWTVDAPVSTVGGLWHLEGETVSILADGNVLPQQVVVNGSVSLGRDATRVVVGLPYRCISRTLPLTAPDAVIEGRRKRIVGVILRLNESRGVKVGTALGRLYPLKERTTELWGEPTELISGVKMGSIQPIWDDNGQFYMVVDDPVPATVLGVVTDLEVGDDKD